MKEEEKKYTFDYQLVNREPQNTFEKIVMYPKALDELKTHELEMARDQGLAWLKEIDRLHNDALDTIERNHKRSGRTEKIPIADGDDLELPSGAGAEYSQAIQWHKKAKEQAESAITAIQNKLQSGDSKISDKLHQSEIANIEYFLTDKVRKTNRPFAKQLLIELEILKNERMVIQKREGDINVSGTLNYLMDHKINEDPPVSERQLMEWIKDYTTEYWDFPL